jgi:hypothetical protein
MATKSTAHQVKVTYYDSSGSEDLKYEDKVIICHLLYHSEFSLKETNIFKATADTISSIPSFKEKNVKLESLEQSVRRAFYRAVDKGLLRVELAQEASKIKQTEIYKNLFSFGVKSEEPFIKDIQNRSRVEIYAFPNSGIFHEELGRAISNEIERICRFLPHRMVKQSTDLCLFLLYNGRTLKSLSESINFTPQACKAISSLWEKFPNFYSPFVPVIGEVQTSKADPRIYKMLADCSSNNVCSLMTQKLLKDMPFFQNTHPAFLFSVPAKAEEMKSFLTNDDVSHMMQEILNRATSVIFSVGSTIAGQGNENNFQKIYTMLDSEVNFEKDEVIAELFGRCFCKNLKCLSNEMDPTKYFSNPKNRIERYSNLSFRNLGPTIQQLSSIVNRYDAAKSKIRHETHCDLQMGACLIIDEVSEGKAKAVATLLKIAEPQENGGTNTKLLNRLYCTSDFLKEVKKEYDIIDNNRINSR